MKNDLEPALVEYGQANQDMVVLDADLSQDRFARTAPDIDSLLDYCGLSVKHIIEAAKTIVEKQG